jgi:hypothetical protein
MIYAMGRQARSTRMVNQPPMGCWQEAEKKVGYYGLFVLIVTR